MLFADNIVLDGAKRTADGYLVADVRVGRIGVQDYAGYEMGKPEMERVRVYRDEALVFEEAAMQSAAHRPITIDHPRDPVSAANWKKLSVGQTGSKIARDGDFLRVDMVMMDAPAIAEVQAGKRALSLGYEVGLDWTPGTTPTGQAYDARQVLPLRINHLAVVDAARAGLHCRIGDSFADFSQPTTTGGQQMADALRTVIVDGLPTQMSDRDAAIVERHIATLNTKAADAQKLIETRDGEIVAIKATHQAALDAKAGEIVALTAKVLSDAQIDQAAAARADLIGQAKAILGPTFQATGKSGAEIRKACVIAKVGDAAATLSDGAIEGAFVVIAKDVKPQLDPLRQTFTGDQRTADQRGGVDPEASYNAMRERDRNAWQMKKGA